MTMGSWNKKLKISGLKGTPTKENLLCASESHSKTNFIFQTFLMMFSNSWLSRIKKKKKFLFWSNLLYSDKVFRNHKTPLNAVLYFAGISQMQHMPIQAEYGKHLNMEYSRKQDFHIVCQCTNLISNCDLQRFVITICILFFRQCNFWLNSFLGSHSFFVLGLLKCWDS